jgi:hypothetical protein
MEYPDELDFEYEAFSPAAQRYLATPSRFEGEVGRPTQRTSLGDDFQTYTPIGESGSSWGGRTTTYQVYDAYGNPTEVIDVAQSGGIKDALQTAAQVFGPTLMSAGLGSLISPYIGQAASAVSDILGGGTVGGIGSAATTGALNSAVGAALSGNSLQDALLTGAIGGAASPLASSLVEPLGLPQPITNIVTKGLTAELVGKDAEKALINAALGELLAATREQPMPQGMTPREQAAFLEANLSELQSAPLYEFPSVEMSPREREAFLEANIPEPEVVQQLMQGYYPDLEPIASRTSMTPNEMNQFLEANIEEPAVIDQLMSTYYPELIPSGNLEQDFVVAQRPEGPVIEDTAGNRGEFIDGAWTVRTDPIQFSDYVAPPSVAAAPTPAPAPAAASAAPPPPAPTASRGLDIGALMAMMGAMGAGQPQQRDEYQLADVAPGVKSGLEAIEQMFGRG